MPVSPRLITASRRTDVPAFYSRWLRHRLEAGFCHVLNPYNGSVSRVELAPRQVAAVAFFTRDPRPLLPQLPCLLEEGFRFYAHVTVNGYPRAFEPHAPALEDAVRAVRLLSGVLGTEHVLWRYDPVVLSDATPAAWHRERFATLAGELSGAVAGCYLSFATWYTKTERRLGRVAAREGWRVERPSQVEQGALARALLDTATAHGLRLFACAADDLVEEGLERGRCADALQIAALRPDLALALKAAPTRPGCGCCAATDIGAFDSCCYGCEYCYATRGQSLAVRHRREHDPCDSILWRPPSLRGVDLERVVARLSPADASPQGPLFV